MRKGSKSKQKLLGLALAGIGAIMSSQALAGNTVVKTNSGLKVYHGDGDFWFKLNGRLMFDQTFFNGSNTDRTGYPSGANVRSARVDLKGGFHDDWAYKFQYDFETATAAPQLREAFLAYVGYSDVTLAVGQFYQPVGMERWTPSSDWTFLEASLPTTAFAPGLGLGLFADWHNDVITLAGAVATPRDAATAGTATSSDNLGVSARVTYSPVHDDHTVWHFGASMLVQDLHNTNNTQAFATGPEAMGRDGTATNLTTGALASVNDYTVYGFEGAGKWGPLTVQGEVMFVDVDRATGTADLDFDGYYVQATYSLTGEERPYDFVSGTFGSVHPKAASGAWEVAARYSFVGLSDQTVVPGSEHNLTFGVNWYVNHNLRFQANYILANLPANRDLDILGLRAQVNW